MRIWIADIQRFSLHDGPGIRTVVFLQGCPLRCAWCHNPECQIPGPRLTYSSSRCRACGKCVQVCPESGHSINEGLHGLKRSNCKVCGRCVETCPTGALNLVGEQRTPQEIMEVVRRDKAFYENSGGGLTISGGEPLAQAKGARSLLSLARKEKIHTAIETCGLSEWKVIAPLVRVVDLWLYDIKQMDPDTHRAITGFHNRRILANLGHLLDNGAKVILRIPLIPGCNDEDRFFSRLTEWISRNGGPEEVHLMPYNRLAESKYESLGEEYSLKGLQPPSQQFVDTLTTQFEELGLTVRVGG
ncbi:MAG: glycyl-radical enzyme activating protein [Armatimonadetes bacterium]|nr:glycyl-radical enzyme activating protein [Armatimonadota bacterium]NIO74990.1 glycyl-radical enzyme activating protein [Armatimonadota bacterium]NIO95695.1 glycyl-radical enzyme activating protein [Armatimonadota bacterium]